MIDSLIRAMKICIRIVQCSEELILGRNFNSKIQVGFISETLRDVAIKSCNQQQIEDRIEVAVELLLF